MSDHLLHDEKLKELEEKAMKARELTIEELVEAKSGHTAGPLGMADIFTALYFHVLNHDPKNPDWEERDRLFLSNGHICPIRYTVMAMAGYFPLKELKTLRKFGSRLQGHPERERLPGVETTSGPLGSGLGQSAGYAYTAEMDKKHFRIYCITSDGEHEAGNHWEAVMFAGKYRLSNLTCIIDRNNIQIDGPTEEIMPLEPLEEKYKAFNWNVINVDGHNMKEFVNAVGLAKAVSEKPTVIIAHTIPGKGVPDIEGDYLWHGIPPKPDEAKHFINDIRTLKGKIKSEHE
ncbi:MAG: transketolase [Patescibacteria group bacterium]